MRNPRSLFAFAAVCGLLAGSTQPASADDRPVVTNRLYDLSGRLELALTPAFSVADKYTQHVGTSLGLAYYFNDYIGLEIDAGYAFVSSDISLLDEILQQGGEAGIQGVERLPLSDLKRMSWWGTGGLVFSPLYGKLNLSAEIDFNFHFYIVGGAGVADYSYTELRWTGAAFRKEETHVGVEPTYYFGGGLKIHFPKGFSLRIEVRDMFFYDKYDAQKLAATGDVVDKQITDFVHITLMRLGVCYSFF